MDIATMATRRAGMNVASAMATLTTATCVGDVAIPNAEDMIPGSAVTGIPLR